jgi:MFS family permease
VLIAGAGMFGVFLFVTYYLQLTLGYSPIQTGLSFLPMIGMLVLAAQLGTNLFVPRFGPKLMVPIGMTLGAIGMVDLTFLDASSTYVPNVLAPLMIIGFAMGTIMPASMQTATLGVDRQFAGVASAMVNTSQQVGGSIGTALLNTLAATAAADYLAAHAPVTEAVGVQAAITSYSTAYWWGAGFFTLGAVLSAVLFRRRGDGLSLTQTERPAPERAPEPVPVA